MTLLHNYLYIQLDSRRDVVDCNLFGLTATVTAEIHWKSHVPMIDGEILQALLRNNSDLSTAAPLVQIASVVLVEARDSYYCAVTDAATVTAVLLRNNDSEVATAAGPGPGATVARVEAMAAEVLSNPPLWPMDMLTLARRELQSRLGLTDLDTVY